MINLHVLPFLTTAPIGEQCKLFNGGLIKGPDVWPLEISFDIASFNTTLFCLADSRFFGCVI